MTASSVPSAASIAVPPLAERDGLPDALKALLRVYPRESWTGHARFDGLTRFWLERHLMFRRATGHLIETVQATADGSAAPEQAGRTVAGIGGQMINELHGHHMIEDQHYFPVLARREPRLVSGFGILDADHHQLDSELQALVAELNRFLELCQSPDAVLSEAGATSELLRRFERFLHRHLEDEEDLVVPVILEHGDP